MGGRKRVWIVVVAAVLAGNRVRAADGGDLIKQGVELRRRGDDAGALKLFEQAYAAGHAPRALAQVALAEQALGRWVAASEHLHEVLEGDDSGQQKDPWIVKNRATLVQALARVEDHVGRLEILGGPAGAEVRIDGTPRGTLPLARPLATTTGPVAIELLAPGYLPIERTTSVRAHETTRESFDGAARPVARAATGAGAASGAPATTTTTAVRDDAGPRPGAAGATPDSPAGSGAGAVDGGGGATSRRWPLVLAAGGAATAALVFGVVEHLSWQSKVDSFASMSACGSGEPGRGGTACADLYDAGGTAKKLALVGYGLGGALAITTAILFVTTGPSGPANNDGQRVACAVSPFAPAPGVGCTLRF